MKIQIKTEGSNILSHSVTTDKNHKIDNITDIEYHAGVGEIPRATITVNSMGDSTFELLDKHCDIEIRSHYLGSFPTYEIIEHLKEMGYQVTPKK
jgi:hypothetical protein